MKIAIIGASCFIGKHLTIKANNRDYKVIAVVRNIRYHEAFFSNFSNVELLECDMQNYTNLDTLIGKVDCAVYLTWNGTRGDARSDYKRQKTNYEQSMIAIKALVNAGCQKILLAGSQAEYGPWFLDRKCTEVDEANPNTEYGKFKLKLYHDAKFYCDKHNAKLIEPRFFSLYGADDFEGTMVISMLKKMLRNEPCDLTECKQKWDFLYIDDAITGLLKLIEDNNAEGIYNFGSGISYQLKFYIEEMCRVTQSHSKLNYGVVSYPKTGMVNVDPCVDKLKNLGWKPLVSFEEGIKRIIQYLINTK